MAITLESLELGAVDSGAIIETSQEGSAFYKLGKKVVGLGPTGQVFHNLTGQKAFGIGEGGKKVASGKAVPVKINPNKIQTSSVFTEEMIVQKPAVADALFNSAPVAVSVCFDDIIAGVAPVPAAWTNFATLSTAAEKTIGVGEAASVDFDDAVGSLVGGVYNGMVVSSSMLSYMRRQRNSRDGRVFEITADTIDGLPYAVFNSTTKVGFVGDFRHLLVSLETFVSPVSNTAYRLGTEGSITDTDGTTHNLLEENKTAVIYEVWAGAAAVLSSFVKLVPAV